MLRGTRVEFELGAMRERAVEIHILAGKGDRIKLEGNLVAKEVVEVDGRERGAPAKELLDDASFERAVLLGFQILVGQRNHAKGAVDAKGFFETRLLDAFAVGKAQACGREQIASTPRE